MQTRIRWNDDELALLAAEIHRLRLADPSNDLLSCARQAQSVLAQDRRRDLKQWSDVALRLQPKLDLLAGAPGDESPPSALSPPSSGVAEPFAAESSPAPAAAPVAAQPSGALAPAHAAPSSSGPAPDPLMVEASLLAALHSPAVANALVELFSKSMAEAFSRMSERGSQPQGPVAPRSTNARVLLAGFAPNVAKGLEDSIRALCDVRSWRPAQGPQLFETLAKMCNVAVIPDEMDDEVDSDLRSRNLLVIRHGGSSAKLLERLESVL